MKNIVITVYSSLDKQISSSCNWCFVQSGRWYNKLMKLGPSQFWFQEHSKRLKWALYHLWSGYAWCTSYICKSSNKYVSRDNRFSGTEKRNRSQPGRWLLPNSKNARVSVSLLSLVRKDQLQRKAGTAECFFRNEFIIQTQIHSNIYSINISIGILAEIQSLH